MNKLLSFTSVKLDLFSRAGTHLQPASGFLLETGSRFYLITSLHVLSGRYPGTSEREDLTHEPYVLKLAIHSHYGEDENSFPLSMGNRQRITLPLYDNQQSPTWLQCQPKGASEPPADIAALLVQPNKISRLMHTVSLIKQKSMPPIFQRNSWSRLSAIPLSAIDTDVDYGPPDPVHVVGYPHGWAPEGANRASSAFWRTSFIASEIYEAGMSRADTFFVDPCAPSGMTGSPVVGMKDDRVKLLGVYSDGSTADIGANAGLVYGAWLLKDLIGAS